jgi:hypothetical protein
MNAPFAEIVYLIYEPMIYSAGESTPSCIKLHVTACAACASAALEVLKYNEVEEEETLTVAPSPLLSADEPSLR